MELRRLVFSMRALLVYMLAGLPVLVAAAGAVAMTFAQELPSIGELAAAHSAIFAGFVLRVVVFFGSLLLFSALVRREIQDRTMHYYFLSPARREVILGGKFMAAWMATSVLFCLSATLTFVLMFVPHGLGTAFGYVFTGPGFSQLLLYLLAVALACLAYGSLFLALGVFFRNPALIALVWWGWEFFTVFLPTSVKRLTIVHYLETVQPALREEGLFALTAEALPKPVAVLVLLLVTALLVALAGMRVRRVELAYGSE
jgi:ABC-type transport system involved in cytochrome c biogenesis permease component